MALTDESAWRGKFCSAARFGEAANLEALTDNRRMAIRSDIAPYPF